MTGALQHRVNREWDNSILSGFSPFRFFWEWLHFIEDHSALDVVEVGTGTTSHGNEIPGEWLTWNGGVDPTTLAPIPLDHNSWIVFRAPYADVLLNGGGTMPWEAKIQVAGATAYADPSGVDYGLNGRVHQVGLRSSAGGGWSGNPNWDFIPGSTEASQDMPIFGYPTTSQAAVDYYLDIVGDNETIWWRGSAGNFPTDSPYNRSRGGYLGLINRRNEDIIWPFFATAGPINNTNVSGGYDRSVFSRKTSTYYPGVFHYYSYSSYAWVWRSYSIGHDGTKITSHIADAWGLNAITRMSTFHYSGEAIYPYILLAQYDNAVERSGIIGELRGYIITDTTIPISTVFGANSDLIQIGYDEATYGGAGMPWPSGVTPIW